MQRKFTSPIFLFLILLHGQRFFCETTDAGNVTSFLSLRTTPVFNPNENGTDDTETEQESTVATTDLSTPIVIHEITFPETDHVETSTKSFFIDEEVTGIFPTSSIFSETNQSNENITSDSSNAVANSVAQNVRISGTSAPFTGSGDDATTVQGDTGSGTGSTTSLGSGDGVTTPQDSTGDGEGATTMESVTGSGTGAMTTPDTNGSGSSATTTQDSTVSGDGATTTDITSGSGEETTASDVTTDDTVVTIISTTPMIVDVFSTEAVTDNATVFNVTSSPGAVVPTGLDAWVIATICLGIVIFILLIILLFFCWKYIFGKEKTSATRKDTLVENYSNKQAEEMRLKPLPIATSAPVAPKLEEANKVTQPAVTSFVSIPSTKSDPARNVRKREVRPRIEPSTPPSSDEGFNEPLMKKEEIFEKPVRKPPRRRKLPDRKITPPQPERIDTWVDGTLVTGRPVSPPRPTQPVVLPPLIPSALVSKALGDSLTDDALAHRHALQRSEIERHRNKQRMRRQRANIPDEAYMTAQKDIDKVLLNEPPPMFQPTSQHRKRHHKRHGRMDLDHRRMKDPDVRLLIGDGASGGGKYRRLRDESFDESTGSEASTSSIPTHEATIAKMSKLLEEAYALLAPVVQKVKPATVVPQQSAGPPQQPYTGHPDPHPAAAAPTEPNDKFFTRTQTPTVFLPKSDLSSMPVPATYSNSTTIKADDSQSVIWTPYRTFDALMKLQSEDPSASRSPSDFKVSNIPSYPNGTEHLPSGYVGETQPIPGGVVPVTHRVGSYPPNSSSSPASAPKIPYHSGNSGDTPDNSDTVNNAMDTSSLVQSIKDTLSRLTGSSTPVQELTTVKTDHPN